MKLSAKLFLLVFTIITFVSITSAFIYHTLAQQLLENQQSKNLVNSANDFIFAFQELIASLDEEFQQNKSSFDDKLSGSNLDFVFEIGIDSSLDKNSLKINSECIIYTDVSSLKDFLHYNTNLVVRNSKVSNKNFFYGIKINTELIHSLSQKIRAEIALVEENVVSTFTNSQENQYYLPLLSRLSRELKEKNNFELVYETLEDVDFSATHYSPRASLLSYNDMDFIIFNISKEASAFKDTMNLVTAVIVISGILLTVIFLFLFTTKFRNQMQFITDGVSNIASGYMNERVKIITKDEIGGLGSALNNMLNEIEKRDFTEKEYAEFISIINQNPTLSEVGGAALQKIISVTNADAGAFYLYDKSELIPFAVLGLSNQQKNISEESSFYKKAKENGEILEINFKENQPIIRTGITELSINHLFIVPIFYNNEIIAILELASVNKPKIDVKQYLSRIKDQLAIGLANGKSLTELKNLVIELQNLNKAFQEQNIEITKKNKELLELHQKLQKGSEELEIQTNKAVESEKVKSQFLANMSHELRTPQNSILGLTELILQDETTSSKTKERLNVVLRNGKKLLTLIENILEYSKLECGSTDIKKSKIHLSELVKEVDTFISPLFLENECKFILQSPKDYDYELFTDVKKVEQIIYNLIGNAAKFTKKGYVKLEILVDGKDLRISVEDTGPGISVEDKKIIFEEFRQADANLNRKFSGTGLGLAICKRYSEMLDANINVKSKVDIGSKFTVHIPEIIKSKKERITTVKDSQLKSLIISDGSHSIKLISDYLKSHNILVDVKGSSQVDTTSVLESLPNIIILDVLLKNKNGWELLVDIKENNKISDIPVVIVNMDEEANCGLGLNIYKYFVKPLNRYNIHSAIEDIEEQLSLKFRKLMFIMEDEKFNRLENDLLSDELRIMNANGKNEDLEYIHKAEPDLIIVDLFENPIEPIKLLTELNSDLYCKTIPILAFIESTNLSSDIEYINNSLIETTLIKQYHPLDILKVIKDRIELFNNSVFKEDQKIISKNDSFIKLSKSTKTDIEGKAKILIVDDNADARFTIGEIISSLGFIPEFASNGFECLKKLKTQPPDLILLDIMMPQMDGFQTIKKIREDDLLKNINVLALTAYAMLSDKEIIEKEWI